MHGDRILLMPVPLLLTLPSVEDGNLITSPHYKYNGEWMKLVISKIKK